MQRLAELVGPYRTRQPLPPLRACWRDGAVALVGEEVVDNLLR
ncbi:hypothetical protein ACFYRJ_38635 [Streptomyces sp. NPDC005531]